MARMHARRRGKSGSVHPPIKTSPKWVELFKDDIEKVICDLAKQDKTMSEIGMILRDQYGVPSVKAVLGKSIKQVLEENKLAPEYPEDLMNLMRKAVKLRKHLSVHKKDIHNTRALQLVESKIRRLAKYYTRVGQLPQGWRYTPEKAALIVKER